MAKCSICLRDKRPKFKTSRLTVCTRCVNLLNSTSISPRSAESQLKQKLRADVVHRHGDDGGVDAWVNRRFPDILDDWCRDPERMGVPIKVIRAYRRQLICLDRRFLDYPNDWRMRAYRHKHRDDYTCNVCGKRYESCGDLQAHHIIFRSRSGTNYAANIVVLCLEHHQAQHPNLVISVLGGEGPGSDQDDSSEGPAGEEITESPIPAPPSLWIPQTPTMQPRCKFKDGEVRAHPFDRSVMPAATARNEEAQICTPLSTPIASPQHQENQRAPSNQPEEKDADRPVVPSESLTADTLWTVLGICVLVALFFMASS